MDTIHRKKLAKSVNKSYKNGLGSFKYEKPLLKGLQLRNNDVKNSLDLNNLGVYDSMEVENEIVKNTMNEKPKWKYRRHNKILIKDVSVPIKNVERNDEDEDELKISDKDLDIEDEDKIELKTKKKTKRRKNRIKN